MELEPKDPTFDEHHQPTTISGSNPTTPDPKSIEDNPHQLPSDSNPNFPSQSSEASLVEKDPTPPYKDSFETLETAHETRGPLKTDSEQPSELFMTADTLYQDGLGRSENRIEEEASKSKTMSLEGMNPDGEKMGQQEGNNEEGRYLGDERPIKRAGMEDSRPLKPLQSDLDLAQNPFGERGAKYYARLAERPLKSKETKKEKMVEEPKETVEEGNRGSEKKEKMEVVEEKGSMEQIQRSHERPLTGKGNYLGDEETQGSGKSVRREKQADERPLPKRNMAAEMEALGENKMSEEKVTPDKEKEEVVQGDVNDERPLPSKRGSDMSDVRPIGSSRPFNFGDERPLKKAPAMEELLAAEGMEQEDTAQTGNPNEPLSSRVKSKVWKIRQSAFEELAKTMANAGANDPIFSEYAGDLVKFIADANPGAQEKALEALKAYIQKQGMGSLDGKEAVKSLIDKALGPGKPNLKKISNEILCLMYEKGGSSIFEPIIDSINHKNQKTSCAGVQAVSELLANYGPKKLEYLKPFYPHIEKLAGSTVSGLRNEAMGFYKEAYKYMGESLKPFLSKLKKAQLDELEKYFSEAPREICKPLKGECEQESAEKAVVGKGKGNEGEFDAYEIVDAVDIFKKFNEAWSEKVLEQSKWSDRKAMLEDLLKEASSTVKIANTPYQHIAGMLKKLLSDNNITVMVTAIKVYAALAKGLRKNFNFTCKTILPTMLGKLKDKRAQIIDETGKALDNFLYCMSLDEALEDIKESLNDKTLEAKMKTMAWIERACDKYAKTPEKVANSYRNLLPIMKKLSNDSSGEVRENAMRIMARWKVMLGDAVIKDSYSDLGAPKLAKIQELVAGLGGSSAGNDASFSERETPVGSKGKGNVMVNLQESMEEEKMVRPVTKAGEASKVEQKVVQRPSTAAPKLNKPSTTKKMGSSKTMVVNQNVSARVEEEAASCLSVEDAENKMVELGMPGFVVQGMNDNSWKEKLKAITNYNKWLVENMAVVGPYIEHVVKYLKAKLKDWKESNINILKETFSLIINIVRNKDIPLSKRTFSLLAPFIIANIHDTKYTENCQTIVYAFIEATNPKSVVLTLINCIQDKNAKPNPKALVEMCALLTKLIDELTLKFIPLKELIDFGKNVISNQNPASRTAAIGLFKSVYQQLGPPLNDLMNDVNPQTLKNLHAEFDKIVPNKDTQCKIQFREDAEADIKEAGASNPLDSLPRADISRDVEKLFKKLTDNDWKVRKEGLDALENILTANGNRIVPNGLTDFVAILKTRLADNNKSQAKNFIIFTGKFAAALGPGIKVYAKVLLPELVKNLSDKQTIIRQETLNSVQKFTAELGTPAIINTLLPLLSLESPEMKIEAINWILKNHESLCKSDVKPNVLPLLSALQDKTQEIRLLAEKLLEKCIGVIGTGPYISGLKDMKPAIQKALKPIIDKYRGENEAESETLDLSMEQTQSQKTLLKKNPVEKFKAGLHKSNASTASATNLNISSVSTPSEKKTIKAASPRRGAGIKQRPQTSVNTALNNSMPAAHVSAGNSGNVIKMLGQKGKRQEEENREPWSSEELQDESVDRLKGHFKMNISPDLYAKMFSVDSKKHVEAIAGLKKTLVLEFQGTVDVLDLIVRWFFMRLWDNSNSVIMKESLDYLYSLSLSLEAAEYTMLDFEARVLISCLINQLGTSNKNFQVTLHKIFQKLGSIYPPQKIAVFLFHGMNSQNPEVRVECIGVLSRLIQAKGTDFLVQKDIKVFGKLLGHNDAKIREKAFEVLLEAGKHMSEAALSALIENDAPASALEGLKEAIRVQKGNEKEAEESSDASQKMQTEMQEEKEEHKPLYDLLSPDRMKVLMKHKEAKRETREETEVNEGEGQGEESQFYNRESYGGEMEYEGNGNKVDGEQFDRNLDLLAKGNIAQKLNALVEIYDVVASDEEENKQFLKERADCMLQVVHLVLHSVLEMPKNDGNMKFTIQFLNMVHKLCSVRLFLKNVSEVTLQVFTEEILNRLLAEDEERQEGKQFDKADNDAIVKILNSTMLKILENADPSDMFSVLFELLIKNRRRINNYTKILGLIVKCILKLTKALEQLVNVIQPEKILLKSHMYLIEFGTDPSKIGEDIGIKTIKTILNELVKLYREKIWEAYAKSVQIHPRQDNYIHRWITVILRPMVGPTISPRYPNQSPREKGTSGNKGKSKLGMAPSEENQEEIPGIREIIDSLKRSDNFEEGIHQLYEILAKNPGHNLSPYLRDSTTTFVDYVMMALERVKYQRNIMNAGQIMQTDLENRVQLRALNKQNKINMSADQIENSGDFSTANANLEDLHNKVNNFKVRYGLVARGNNENEDSEGQNQSMSYTKRGALHNVPMNVETENNEGYGEKTNKAAKSEALLQKLGEMRTKMASFVKSPNQGDQ